MPSFKAAIWPLTLYPGAVEAYDRAIGADPGFALAHAGKAQVLMREGDVAAARAALTAAKNVSAGLPTREASHIAFFDLVFAGRTDPAIAALDGTAPPSGVRSRDRG
jgi:Tetratricopeptide repeat